MYEVIRSRPTPREVFARRLVEAGDLSATEAESIFEQSRLAMEAECEQPAEDDPAANGKGLAQPGGRRPVPVFESPLKGLWAHYRGGSGLDEIDTTYDRSRLRDLLVRANTLPEGFTAHTKIARLLQQRLEMLDGKRPLDWAVAEQAAYATLVTDGVRVRLSGQDTGRGTFSHRHAVLTDVETGLEHFPLQHLEEGQAPFHVVDSSLSEAGCLGFEFGYSWDYPDALVLWEAQFGDFVNGAQVIIDQYLASTEQKWNRYSGIVLLLPHGYEGQGPEHSSARLERFLQLCAEENLQVANCSTPASFYHLLRRQALRRVRKPLVVMAPKSLLRHAEAISSLDDLAEGAFQRVIPEREDIAPADVRRVVLCSGKVTYDLLAARRERNERRVAIASVELLYPFPGDDVAEVLAGFPNDAEVVWCQEEPRNMGAWPMWLHWWMDHVPGRPIRFVGRPNAASPATGSFQVHRQEQERLVSQALTL
jgi:2-oxoglutarate dehydrogenase E1 component